MSTGVKKSFVREPGTSSINKDKHIFSSNLRWASKNIQCKFECPVVFGNRISTNLGVRVLRTSEDFKIFSPRLVHDRIQNYTVFE